MKYTVKEVLQFVEGNDVKFVRLVFFDIFGIKKNISIMASELKSAFENGVPVSVKNISGLCQDGKNGELLLFPDPNTLKILAWRPQQGAVVRLLCDLRTMDGKRFCGDIRTVLKKAMLKADNMGFSCLSELECEFYLFKLDDDGEPTKIPNDNAGYLDVAPLDKSENVRRQICLTLEDMDIPPLSSHHESGHGQNEIDFKYGDLLSTADDYYTFKSVVKTAAASNGLYASFMPKPLPKQCGSGMKISLIMRKYKENIFTDKGGGMSDNAKSFIAGIMRRLAEITLFLNPLENSYSRFAALEIPDSIQWSYNNAESILRVSAVKSEKAKLTLRSPDPSCNLYLSLALLLFAGLEGIEDGLALSGADSASEEKALPVSLEQAVAITQNSEFVKKYIPPIMLSEYIRIKNAELTRSRQSTEYRQKLDDSLFRII